MFSQVRALGTLRRYNTVQWHGRRSSAGMPSNDRLRRPGRSEGYGDLFQQEGFPEPTARTCPVARKFGHGTQRVEGIILCISGRIYSFSYVHGFPRRFYMVTSFKELSKDSGFDFCCFIGFWVTWGMFNAFFVGSHDVRASFGRSNKHVFQKAMFLPQLHTTCSQLQILQHTLVHHQSQSPLYCLNDVA